MTQRNNTTELDVKLIIKTACDDFKDCLNNTRINNGDLIIETSDGNEYRINVVRIG